MDIDRRTPDDYEIDPDDVRNCSCNQQVTFWQSRLELERSVKNLLSSLSHDNQKLRKARINNGELHTHVLSKCGSSLKPLARGS